MLLKSAIRRTGRGDMSHVYIWSALACFAAAWLAMGTAYGIFHNRLAPAAVGLAIAAAVVAFLVRIVRDERHRRAGTDWATFESRFRPPVRKAVRVLCDPDDRTAAFGHAGLVSPELVHGRRDWGVWPTRRGATVRISGIDPEALALASGVLAAQLEVPAVVFGRWCKKGVRRIRYRDGRYELIHRPSVYEIQLITR